MEQQQEHNKIDRSTFREIISPEYNLIKTSDTMGGALTHLASLFRKIQTLPIVNGIIAEAEAELAKEDRLAFENLEKAVVWFHEKINILLPHVGWHPSSFEMAHVNSLLNFKTISLSAGGYVGSLHFELRRLFIEVARKEKNHPAFEGWTRIDANTGQRIFDWPENVDRALNSIPVEQQIYQWKEKADTHLPCLLQFLKILTLYNTYQPLVLEPHPDPNTLPNNLRELGERECQAHIGYYLSAFSLNDSKEHPLSKAELITLVGRFLYMLEQNIEPNSTDTPKQLGQAIPVSNQEEAYKSNPENWRTKQYKKDIDALIPSAKKLWLKYIPKCKCPMKLGRKKLAEKLINNLPTHISLHVKGNGRLTRAKKALKLTDPRIWENGKCTGLNPHWQEFNWVNI